MALQQYLAWRAHPGHLRAPAPLCKGNTGTSLSWFLLFAHVTLDCRELFFKSNFIGLDLRFILRTFFEVVISSEDCCVLLCFVLFFSELPGLFIRTINRFSLDLQFFAYAAATLWENEWGTCRAERVSVCVNGCAWGIPQIFLFLFCVKIFSTDFPGFKHCLLCKKLYWIIYSLNEMLF